jgi:Asp-tRNA(Asn)/Glu-tRNA(Gln) amidotransferase A subunit family amidase
VNKAECGGPCTCRYGTRRARQDAAVARGDFSPFHGVPMTVKDAKLAGVPSTGHAWPCQYIPRNDATVIGRMRAAGAIPSA